MIGKTIAHYRITEKIGAGGMGVVYRAQDTHLDRSVAIKVLPAEAVADPERKRRFAQEAKSASALNHPNIIHIYDIDRADGTDFIAMEYVPGKTLDQLIAHKGLQINEALKYAVQIADALATAHAAGIVHRDLKPANIMVTEKGLVKVLDFGLAKLSAQGGEFATTLTASPTTEQGMIVGTVSFMSPEQAEGKKVEYFSSDRGGSMNLWRVPIEEKSGKVLGQPEPVTTGGGTASRQHLSISRDGRRMAFVERTAKSNIQKVPFDPSRETVIGQPVWITQGSKRTGQPDPSPDGNWVAFMSAGPPQEDLFLIRTDGTRERQITNDPDRDRTPRWSPDGKRIVFYSNRVTGQYQVWAINPDGSGLERLGETDRTVNNPIWSPDGLRIAYSETPLDNFISEVGRSWKDHTERLPLYSESEAFIVRSWSPDGKYLAGHLIRKQSNAMDPGGTAVYSLETKQFEKLTDFGWGPCWLSDSQRLLFPYQDKIYITDRGSKKVRELFSVNPYTISGYNLRISKDDRMIYYGLQMNEADIWLMTLQ